MFEKLRLVWRTLSPDLMTEPSPAAVQAQSDTPLSPAVLAALGGASNLKSQQPLALTRVRVALHDPERLDIAALRVSGVPGVMPLADGVVHLLVGL